MDKLDELRHYGVLGMKWGVRKDNKPQGYQGNGARQKKTKLTRADKKDAKVRSRRDAKIKELENKLDIIKKEDKRYQEELKDLEKNGTNSSYYKQHFNSYDDFDYSYLDKDASKKTHEQKILDTMKEDLKLSKSVNSCDQKYLKKYVDHLKTADLKTDSAYEYQQKQNAKGAAIIVGGNVLSVVAGISVAKLTNKPALGATVGFVGHVISMISATSKLTTDDTVYKFYEDNNKSK